MKHDYYISKFATLNSQLENLIKQYSNDEDNSQFDPVIYGLMLSAVSALSVVFTWLAEDCDYEAKA